MQLTRRFRFVASHRLHTDEISPEENARLYGKCNNPYGHGHDYILDVSVEGEPDGNGQLIHRGEFESYVQSNVLEHLDHRNLNMDVPELEGQVATTENLASAIHRMLRDDWKFPAKLVSLRISETARNTFELKTDPTDAVEANR